MSKSDDNVAEGTSSASQQSDAEKETPVTPLPRSARKQPRAKEDRGLPPDEELVTLVRCYRKTQCELWPELVKADILHDATEEEIPLMVEDYKARHRGAKFNTDSLAELIKRNCKFGGNYDRYSCDNSDPKSIEDQMVKCLHKAREEGIFIPWCYIFADYSVSGVTAARRGYTSYKEVLGDEDHLVDVTFVDDFTRASREELQWWKLAAFCRKNKKQLLGASDGFDLLSPNGEIMVWVYLLVSRLFLKGTSEKVKRGMGGAARRHTCLGKPSLGFTRRPKVDERGHVVRSSDGDITYEWCVDPVTKPIRALIFELFVVKRWSVYQIAKYFNKHRIDDWDHWTENTIWKLLWSASAIGVFIWNRTRRVYNPDTEKYETVVNPRSEWVIVHRAELAIVPFHQWVMARKLLSASRRKSPTTGRKRSRNEICASTLTSGTEFCDYCGHEIVLHRSAGKYKSMYCPNGRTGKGGCKLSASKSVSIIEKCLLDYLQERLLTGDVIAGFVAKANAYLAEEGARPSQDTVPLKRRIAEKEKQVSRLTDRVAKTTDDGVAARFEKQIALLERDLRLMRSEHRDLERQNTRPPAPLDLATIKSLLADLPGIFTQEIPAAAAALRELTGPIRIRQMDDPTRKHGATWIAKFNPDFIEWLRGRAKSMDCPASITLDYLKSTGWKHKTKGEFEIDGDHAYERYAPEVMKLRAEGVSQVVIARTLKISPETVRLAIRFAATGERPPPRSSSKKMPDRDPQSKGLAKYKLIAPEVVRLAEIEYFSRKEIAEELKVAESTVEKAYDFARPEAALKAAKSGTRPKRPWHRRLSKKQVATIHALLKAGKLSGPQIAAKAKCHKCTVAAEAMKLRIVLRSGARPKKKAG